MLVLGALVLTGVSTESAAAPRDSAGLPALGLNTNALQDIPDATRQAELARLAAMGAGWIREGVPWDATEPSPGQLDPGELARIDRVVSDAASVGLRVLFTGDNEAPQWAAGSVTTAYGRFMGLLAAHLRGRGSPAYELMNEPDDGIATSGKPDATPVTYAHAACSAYRAIKSADPGAVVAAGALDVSTWQPWLRSAFGAGLGGCFDVLSAHPYGGLSALDQIRAVAAEEGRRDVTVWVTEFGASTCDDPTLGCVSEDAQASSVTDTLRQLRQSYPWVPVAMIYEACDEPGAGGPVSETSFGVFHANQDGTCLLDQPKPAVASITTLYG